MRRKSAAWVSVAVLAATVAALCLISIGDKVYRKQDHRVLITLAEPADRPPV